jgi:hypothetical protein
MLSFFLSVERLISIEYDGVKSCNAVVWMIMFFSVRLSTTGYRMRHWTRSSCWVRSGCFILQWPSQNGLGEVDIHLRLIGLPKGG